VTRVRGDRSRSRQAHGLARWLGAPARAGRSKLGAGLAAIAVGFVLAGCTVPGFGMSPGITTQAHDTFKLWVGTFIAGLAVAVLVYLLIAWAIFAYRRRNDVIPPQFHTAIRLEVVYVTVPLLIVGTLFYFTVVTENKVNAISPHPNEVVNVVAYRWGWRFIYADGSHHLEGVTIATVGEPHALPQAATSSLYPQLVLPLGETTEIDLTSTDVIHAMYVPTMNFSRQAIPGYRNVFDFTPTTAGVFSGQCVQYCGLYHSEMLFSVRILPAAAFRQWLTNTQARQAASKGG